LGAGRSAGTNPSTLWGAVRLIATATFFFFVPLNIALYWPRDNEKEGEEYPAGSLQGTMPRDDRALLLKGAKA